MRLTDEQRTFAEANRGLVYTFLRLHRFHHEDLCSSLFLTLTKCAYHYNSSMNVPFSTYAFESFRLDAIRFYRSQLLIHIPLGFFSRSGSSRPRYARAMQTLHAKKWPLECVELAYTSDPAAPLDDQTYSEWLHAHIEHLRPKHRKIMTLLLSGKQQSEVADIMGCSRAYIYFIQSKITKDLKGLARLLR